MIYAVASRAFERPAKRRNAKIIKNDEEVTLKKFLIPALFAAATVLASGATPSSAAEITLRLHTFVPPVANPPKTFLIPWSKKLEKASHGRIKVQPFWAMQLGGNPPQLADQVKDGVVDIVWTLPGYNPGRFPKTEIFELPFLHRDALSTTLALQDYYDKHLKDEYKDYHMLLIHAHQGFLFMTKKPIRKLEDLKGMKLRAPSRVGVWMLSALGATGLGMPLPQIPGALSKGVIDGMILPYEISPAVKAQDLVKYFTDLSGKTSRLGTTVFTFMMNKNSYNKLPSDLKKVVDGLSGRNIAEWAGKNWEQIEIPGEKVMKSKKKNVFYTIPEPEASRFRKAADTVKTRLFAELKSVGIDGAPLLADAEADIAKYAK